LAHGDRPLGNYIKIDVLMTLFKFALNHKIPAQTTKTRPFSEREREERKGRHKFHTFTSSSAPKVGTCLHSMLELMLTHTEWPHTHRTGSISSREQTQQKSSGVHYRLQGHGPGMGSLQPTSVSFMILKRSNRARRWHLQSKKGNT
jgi:hypothetical protein